MACALDHPGISDKASTDQLNCPICLEGYKSPRYLVCMHTFCEGCIQSNILQTAGKETQQVTIRCPLCRSETVPVCPTKPRKEWAKDLPLDSAISSQVGATKIEPLFNCDNCEVLGKQSASTSYCKDCKQYQCSDCVGMHSKVTAIRGHILVDIAELSLEKISLLRLGKGDFCQEHVDKELEFLCEDDNVLCCINCVCSKHRKCENVTELVKLGQGMKDGDKPLQLETQMGDLLKQLGEISGVLEKNVYDLETKAEDIPRKMMDFRNKIVQIMDDLVAKVISECSHLKKQHTTELDDKVTNIKSLEAAITTACSQLNFIMKHGTEAQICIIIHKLEEQLRQYRAQINDIHKNTTTVDLKIAFGENLNRILESADNLTAKVTAELTRLKSDQVPIAYCEMEVLSVVDVPKRQTLKQPKYNGLTFLPDGCLVAVDYNNALCCLLDESFAVLSDLKLPSRPADVTTIGQHEVVVALPESCRLQRIRSDGTTLTLTETIGCPRKPFSVSSVSDTELVVGWNHGLGIFGLDGEERSYIDMDKTGKDISFTLRDFVVAEEDNPRVYRSKCEDHTVDCLDYTGHIHFSYSNNLQYPCGLALDGDHNLYICSMNSHRVHQVSTDGQQIREIDPGMRYPFIICFSQTSTSLLVMDEDIIYTTSHGLLINFTSP